MRHSRHTPGAPSGQYAVRPRLRARGFSRRAGRQGQSNKSSTGLPGCSARTRSRRCCWLHKRVAVQPQQGLVHRTQRCPRVEISLHDARRLGPVLHPTKGVNRLVDHRAPDTALLQCTQAIEITLEGFVVVLGEVTKAIGIGGTARRRPGAAHRRRLQPSSLAVSCAHRTCHEMLVLRTHPLLVGGG